MANSTTIRDLLEVPLMAPGSKTRSLEECSICQESAKKATFPTTVTTRVCWLSLLSLYAIATMKLGHQTGRLGSGSRRMTSFFTTHVILRPLIGWTKIIGLSLIKIKISAKSETISQNHNLFLNNASTLWDFRWPFGYHSPTTIYELSDHLRIFLFQHFFLMDTLHSWFSMGKTTISSHKDLTTTTINTDSLRRRKTHAASGNLGLESLMTARRSDFLPTFCL